MVRLFGFALLLVSVSLLPVVDFQSNFLKNVELRLASDQVEGDPRKLETRNRQIQFGKNTIGYDNYISAVPKYVVISKFFLV